MSLPQPPALPDDLDIHRVSVATRPSEFVPEELVPGLKARAVADGVSDDLLRVNVEGVDHEFILRKPTRAEWHEYIDKAHIATQSATGNWNLAVQCCLWPNQTALRIARDTMPGLASKICDLIEVWIGGEITRRIEVILSSKTDDTVLADIGISRAELEPLLARYRSKGQLRAIIVRVSPDDVPADEVETVSIVLKQPDATTFNALRAGFQVPDGRGMTCYTAAMTSTVWPESEEDRRELFNEYPGLPWCTWSLIFDMGGGLARATAKKL